MLGSPQAESGRELLARLAPRPDLTTVLSELWSKHPVPGDIIEITGPGQCDSHDTPSFHVCSVQNRGVLCFRRVPELPVEVCGGAVVNTPFFALLAQAHVPASSLG